MSWSEANLSIIGKRDSFGKLVALLRALSVSRFMHVPAVSNPYHLLDVVELEKTLGSWGYKYSTKGLR